MAMIAITTSNSINVKPGRFLGGKCMSVSLLSSPSEEKDRPSLYWPVLPSQSKNAQIFYGFAQAATLP